MTEGVANLMHKPDSIQSMHALVYAPVYRECCSESSLQDPTACSAATCSLSFASHITISTI